MKVAIVGAGRTGSRTALLLSAKAELTIIDRDYVEQTDLHDSPTYSKIDLGAPKAEVASRHAGAIPVVDHLGASNADALLGNAQLVLDCTDNWHTRALINEYCWREQKPWVYCAALADKAMCASIVPKLKPCWLCWNAQAPATVHSCSVHGINPLAADAASQKQAAQATQIISGEKPTLARSLYYYDAKTALQTTLPLKARENCPVCANGERTLLEKKGETPMQVCGDGEWQFLNAQLRFRHYTTRELAAKLASLNPTIIGSLLQVRTKDAKLTLFPTGRTLARAPSATQASKANEFLMQKLGA